MQKKLYLRAFCSIKVIYTLYFVVSTLFVFSIGMCILVVGGLHVLQTQFLKGQLATIQRVVRLLIVLVIIFYSVQTILRNPVWRSREDLFRLVLSKNTGFNYLFVDMFDCQIWYRYYSHKWQNSLQLCQFFERFRSYTRRYFSLQNCSQVS